jgi:hypothetical protein
MDHDGIRANAERFSSETFRRTLRTVVTEMVEDPRPR